MTKTYKHYHFINKYYQPLCQQTVLRLVRFILFIEFYVVNLLLLKGLKRKYAPKFNSNGRTKKTPSQVDDILSTSYHIHMAEKEREREREIIGSFIQYLLNVRYIIVIGHSQRQLKQYTV